MYNFTLYNVRTVPEFRVLTAEYAPAVTGSADMRSFRIFLGQCMRYNQIVWYTNTIVNLGSELSDNIPLVV